MMIGHGFPLYQRLCARFQLRFAECLRNDDSDGDYLPPFTEVVDAILSLRPRLIFLLIPNNPLGEQISTLEIKQLCNLLDDLDAYLLVDRVCQMPWDARHPVMEALATSIASGRTVVVDSFSKSESLAGLRTGFAIANNEWTTLFEQMLKSRVLNPIVFSTVTLALTRLAEASPSLTSAVRRLIAPHLDAIYAEYPTSESRYDPLQTFEQFSGEYLRDQGARKVIIDTNFRALKDVFGAVALRPFTVTSGFNVAVTLPAMSSCREQDDQRRLAHEYGIGILPESCFRASRNEGKHYFVRIGLTPSLKDFASGLTRLERFYGS
jgi:aspartate/methionine/tyrosine aminotransferase